MHFLLSIHCTSAHLVALQVAEGLVGCALKRYSSDNISVIVLDFKGAAYWKPSGSSSKGGWLGGLFK